MSKKKKDVRDARASPVPAPRNPRLSGLSFLPLGELEVKPKRSKREQLDSLIGWVYVCVDTLATTVASTPSRIFRVSILSKKRKELDYVDGLTDLLARPNPEVTWTQFIYITVVHFKLTGESFWLVLRDGDGPVNGLQNIPPHWVKQPVFNAERTQLVGWEIIPDGGVKFIAPVDDVIWIRTPHPSIPYASLSPIEALALAQDTDTYARAYGVGLLKNRSVPDLVISTDQELEPEEADLIEERWVQRYKNRRGRPAVLSKGSRIQPIGLNLGDIKFLDLLKPSEDLILAAYRVPRAKVGLVADSNRANSDAADHTFNKEAVQPILNAIQEAINVHLLPLVLREKALLHLWEFISPVKKDRAQEVKEARDAFLDGAITLNEYRETLGRDSIEDGDVYYIPKGRTVVAKPLESSQQGGGTPQAGTGVSDPAS